MKAAELSSVIFLGASKPSTKLGKYRDAFRDCSAASPCAVNPARQQSVMRSVRGEFMMEV